MGAIEFRPLGADDVECRVSQVPPYVKTRHSVIDQCG